MDAATTRPPRILLVGCGQIALLAHLPALAQLRQEGQVELVGVCDGDGARASDAASRFGVARSGTVWSEMARETSADAVALCLPPGPNAEVSVAALEQGLHVLCEKPPGRDAAQAARMAAAAAARADRVTMIAFNRRHAPLYSKALERSRALGDPTAFFGKFTRAGLGERPSNTMDDWITSDGSHALDLAIATVGWPRRVSVSRAGRGGGPDNVWTLHLLGEGRSAVLLFGFASGGRVERFEWTGAGYDVSLELPDSARWSAQGGGEEAWGAKDLTGSGEYFVNYGFLDEYRAFVRAIGGRRTTAGGGLRLRRGLHGSGGNDSRRVGRGHLRGRSPREPGRAGGRRDGADRATHGSLHGEPSSSGSRRAPAPGISTRDASRSWARPAVCTSPRTGKGRSRTRRSSSRDGARLPSRRLSSPGRRSSASSWSSEPRSCGPSRRRPARAMAPFFSATRRTRSRRASRSTLSF